MLLKSEILSESNLKPFRDKQNNLENFQTKYKPNLNLVQSRFEVYFAATALCLKGKFAARI